MSRLVCLPPELFLRIIDNLAIPTGGNRKCDELFEQNWDYQALAHLASTCKQLCAAVQPVLYCNIYSNVDCVGLLRSLIRNPSLASLVKELYIDDGWGLEEPERSGGHTMSDVKREGGGEREATHNGFSNHQDIAKDPANQNKAADDTKSNASSADTPWALSPDDAALFNREVENYQIFTEDEDQRWDLDEEGSNTHELYGILNPMKTGLDENGMPLQRLKSILATIAILKCRDLARISLQTSYWPLADAKKVDFEFKKLHHFSHSHSDTELSGTIGRHFAWLFTAAPSLILFAGEKAGNFSPLLSSKSLKSLVLTNSQIEETELDSLFRSFPNLERFAFEAGDSTVSHRMATPGQLVTALTHCKTTLKSVKLEWKKSFEYEFGWDDGTHVIETLQNLDGLEEVEIGLEGFDMDEEDVTAEFLAKTFPPSIRKLHIIQCGVGECVPIECLLDVIDESFPRLEEVSLIYDNREELERKRLRKLFNDMKRILKV